MENMALRVNIEGKEEKAISKLGAILVTCHANCLVHFYTCLHDLLCRQFP